MERNGGTLFTKYREGFSMLLLFLLNIFSVTLNAQVSDSILCEVEDSCFCRQYSLLEEEIIMIPEQAVDGLYVSLDSLLSDVRLEILENELKDSLSYRLIMGIVVDKEGEARCGNILIGKNDSIAQKSFNLLKQQKYKPAMTRNKSIVYYFVFMLEKKENNFYDEE